jgi:NAD(P)H-hydrate epimerase
MKYLSIDQMREADRRCIQELGIPGAVLMNTAGAAVFREIADGPVGIVCGKGNNGGDGYVVARLCLNAGLVTRVVALTDRESIEGDAALYLNVFERLGGEVAFAADEKAATEAVKALSDCAVLVDAIFGTGIKGEVRGAGGAAIHAWPDVKTIAVDIPSGINGATGEVCGAAVKAETTVTLHAAKEGFKAESAQPYLGRVVVADIGIPDVCADDAAWEALRRSWRT